MAKRKARIMAAIERLADLYDYGRLMANTDPASLLRLACDEIEARRAGKPFDETESDDGE